jgi:hypothetical protein
MDAAASTPGQTAFPAAEAAKRFLDPLAEWRDCANQWDVTVVWNSPHAAANAGQEGGKENGAEPTGL